VTTHVRVVAALFILSGILLLAAAFFTPIFLGALAAIVGASNEEGAEVGAAILGFTGIAMSLVLAVIGLPYLAAGWGLLQFRNWARILGIILAAMALTSFPLGTAFGVYALIVLFRKDTEALFPQ
jgi:hypothetical protein